MNWSMISFFAVITALNPLFAAKIFELYACTTTCEYKLALTDYRVVGSVMPNL
uniref:Uncharacterized protein n=1 Tax=Vitis vinifera TaxID=29760 RepID=F6GV98_VITVI